MCVYVYVYVYVYVCAYVYVYVCIYIYIYTHTYAHMYMPPKQVKFLIGPLATIFATVFNLCASCVALRMCIYVICIYIYITGITYDGDLTTISPTTISEKPSNR